MVNLTNSSARTSIEVADASQIASMANGGQNVLSTQDMQQLLGNSALVLDGLRRRPRYFDGRFLTGADLTRDQDYVRQRQADLARTGGAGVVAGLHVSEGDDPTGQTITIRPGHGVTPAGDLVSVTTARTFPLLDLPNTEKLDAAFGLRLKPSQPLGRRTGLFILALRAVEFTANPIAAYPTTISGPRQMQDGDIIEATAITLIPYTDTTAAATLDDARRSVARDIFLGDTQGLPQDALPLAMLALERGAIRWIDMSLVRRETGADSPLEITLGARPRALAEAFVLQHLTHLQDVLTDRAASGLPPAFAAAQYFAALPPAGQLPAAAVLTDALGFRQLWFPPQIDVDISFAPADEIAAVVEESLSLPAIDLTPNANLGAAGVVVLAPVSRPTLQRFEQALAQLSTHVTTDLAQGYTRPTADVLAGMLARRTALVTTPISDPAATAQAAASDAQTKAWQAAWAEAVAALPIEDGLPPRLWYVRRRALAYEPKITGIAVPVTGADLQLEIDLNKRLADLGVADRVKKLTDESTPFAAARIAAFLGSPKIMASDAFFFAAVHELEAAVPVATTTAAPATPPAAVAAATSTTLATASTAALVAAARPTLAPGRIERAGLSRLTVNRVLTNATLAAGGGQQLLTEGDIVDVAADFSDPRLGEGLDKLTAALGAPPLTRAQLAWLADNGDVLDLDDQARSLDAADLATFATSLRTAVNANDAAAVGKLIAGEV